MCAIHRMEQVRQEPANCRRKNDSLWNLEEKGGEVEVVQNFSTGRSYLTNEIAHDQAELDE